MTKGQKRLSNSALQSNTKRALGKDEDKENSLTMIHNLIGSTMQNYMGKAVLTADHIS